ADLAANSVNGVDAATNTPPPVALSGTFQLPAVTGFEVLWLPAGSSQWVPLPGGPSERALSFVIPGNGTFALAQLVTPRHAGDGDHHHGGGDNGDHDHDHDDQ